MLFLVTRRVGVVVGLEHAKFGIALTLEHFAASVIHLVEEGVHELFAGLLRWQIVQLAQ